MTVAAVIFFALVLEYQAWSLYVFRNRIAGPKVQSRAVVVPASSGG